MKKQEQEFENMDFIDEQIEKDLESEETEQFMSDDEIEEKHGSQHIFDGGPTFDQVADWKSRFDDEIFMTDFGDDTYIWRPIRRKEWKDMQRIEGQNEFYLEESICRTCVLWPEDMTPQKMTFGKAGVPTMLSQLISEKSGFVRPQTYKI